jgi:mono/diheme cytochrome c family protein
MNSRYYLSLLLISSLVLIAFLGIALNRELNPDWKRYQIEYKDFLVKNAKDASTRERAEKIEIGLQQIYLKSLERSDRCVSCHRGVENPLMAAAEQPHRQHSGKYLEDHPIAKFGCTVCHRGQDRATNMREAHGEEHTHWDFPIIPSKYIQGSCAQCHDYEMLRHEGGEKVARGEELFRQKGCQGCHKINGKGGDLGKDIAGIGSRPFAYFSMKGVVGDHNLYNWIKQHFDDPRAIVPESEMRVFLTDEEAELLTTYMMTFVTEEMPRNYTLIKNVIQPKIDGESLYKMYCIACHQDGKLSLYDEIFKRTIPAIRNPAFTGAINDEHLRAIIKEGRKGTQMTAWKASAAGLTDADVDKIIEYITMDRPEKKPEPFGFLKYKADVPHGEKLYKIRCGLCHGAEGKGGEGFLGINLRNPVVQAADPAYLAVTVRDGRTGTPMPPFGKDGVGLNEQDIADIVSYVKTLSQKKL